MSGQRDNFIAMLTLITRVLSLMPIWYGVFFIGPLLAELTLRTSLFTPVLSFLSSALPVGIVNTIEALPVYGVCMVIGGGYGIFAHVTGRWI
jgi:hypothetical protein